jgi:hypothetical protein
VEIVPGYVPFALLLALEAVAVLVSALVSARGRVGAAGALRCARCVRLHRRTETFGRAADAVAIGALAFLIALPFVAAGYESGVTFPSVLLAASAVVAVIAVVAEADFLARAVAARLWPRLTWGAEPGRIVGGGARWFGAALALYLFEPRDAGIAAAFGSVGRRLVLDVASMWTVYAAAEILVIATIVALLARWLVPLAFGSLPTTFAPCRDPHGSPA